MIGPVYTVPLYPTCNPGGFVASVTATFTGFTLTAVVFVTPALLVAVSWNSR